MIWLDLAIALGLGLLVGLERERTDTESAGIRTFPLITLFGFVTAQLVNRGALTTDTGWRLIAVGALANLLFKGGVVALLGPPALLRRVAWLFGAGLAAGALVLALWPGG